MAKYGWGAVSRWLSRFWLLYHVAYLSKVHYVPPDYFKLACTILSALCTSAQGTYTTVYIYEVCLKSNGTGCAV